MAVDFIKDRFIEECEKHGGEVQKIKYLDAFACKLDDYEKFIDFSRWMQKNILPKQLDIRNEYLAEYDFFDGYDDINASFWIGIKVSQFYLSLKKYKDAEELVYSVEEQVKEEAPSIKSQEVIDSIVSDAIDEWVKKFPIEKDDVTIELSFDDDYDNWIIEAMTSKEINKNDDINKIFNKLEDKLKGELDEIPYPHPEIRKMV